MKKFFFIIITVVMGCNEPNKIKREIDKSNNLLLFTISRNPIDPSLQNLQKVYYQDYEVHKSLFPTQEQIELLKKSLINEDNFSRENVKKCPFLPKYAIDIDSSLTAVISIEPCSRIQFKSITDDNIYSMDLVKGNKIEEILNQILKE